MSTLHGGLWYAFDTPIPEDEPYFPEGAIVES